MYVRLVWYAMYVWAIVLLKSWLHEMISAAAVGNDCVYIYALCLLGREEIYIWVYVCSYTWAAMVAMFACVGIKYAWGVAAGRKKN